jgi:ectoine hydroxylase-related dioxygenase (phytanoyl-CoA dioxygenase family)
MSINSAHFDKNGFVVLDNILSDETIADIELRLGQLPNGNAGTRNLLCADWCKHLSQRIAAHPLIKELLPNPGVAVQCTYFRKSLKRNWLVPLHQDYVIPLKSRFSDPAWSMWSMKEGIHFARPPITILETMVAVRVHLEANTHKNGLLQVIPGSHKSCSTSDE